MEVYRLKNKRAVINGGALGIGRATGISFAREKASVVIIDIDVKEGFTTERKIVKHGVKARYIEADATDPYDMQDAIKKASDFLGGIDILVNCVGGYKKYQSFDEITVEDWDRTIDLNLKSVFLACKYTIPYMKRNGWGRIINIGSLAGRSTSAGTSPAHYGSAKCAVSMLTQYVAKEVARFGITANTVAPGTTLTERVKKLITPEKEQIFLKATPIGRFATPEDIADVIMFLATDESRYITGATIDVNGGRLMLV